MWWRLILASRVGRAAGAAVLGRREFVAMLGVGLAAVLAGDAVEDAGPTAGTAPNAQAQGAPAPGGRRSAGSGSDGSSPVEAGSGGAGPGGATAEVGGTPLAPGSGSATPDPGTAAPVLEPPPLPRIPPPHPGRPKVVSHAPRRTDQIALTIDDGYCDSCVEGYVAFAELTGIHLTFSPNGAYRDAWEPRASRLRRLVALGQVQIGNHTWSHTSLLELSNAGIRREIDRNEAWIERTFGVTARPWFRPPYGFRDERTDEVAASLGYTRILIWDGSFGDSRLLTPQVLLDQARLYLLPGTVMLGHANHPTVQRLYDQIQAILTHRRLTPVTLDEMFGTSRRKG
jgi:peptidoglycan/xylan/chitin deacetylase (PgdA/CDA1 family)